jgi:hypothetical protein
MGGSAYLQVDDIARRSTGFLWVGKDEGLLIDERDDSSLDSHASGEGSVEVLVKERRLDDGGDEHHEGDDDSLNGLKKRAKGFSSSSARRENDSKRRTGSGVSVRWLATNLSSSRSSWGWAKERQSLQALKIEATT